ncbi:unnamed protein product [Urochloa humidicola]
MLTATKTRQKIDTEHAAGQPLQGGSEASNERGGGMRWLRGGAVHPDGDGDCLPSDVHAPAAPFTPATK